MASGGKREGAGRKAIHPEQRRVTLGARVTPQTKNWLADMASEQGVTIGRIIEELVANFIEEASIERRHKGTCRGCRHYENHCPFIAEQNKRGELGCYPNRGCGDYKNREEQ